MTELEKEMAKLLGFIDDKYIITHDKNRGFVYIGGQKVDEARLANLKTEAEFILRSDLWKVLSNTVTHMAHEMMFVKSQKYDDVLSGKMWLYHIDVQKKIMDILKTYQQKPVKK